MDGEDQEPEEQEAFRKLVCDMYTKPYKILSLGQLQAMTRFTDFYRASPALSSSLHKCCLGHFTEQIEVHAFKVMALAKTLRHAEYFQESIIFLSGAIFKTANMIHIFLNTPDIPLLGRAAHSRLSYQVLFTDYRLETRCLGGRVLQSPSRKRNNLRG